MAEPGTGAAGDKTALRKRAKQQRKDAAAANPDAGERLAGHVRAHLRDHPVRVLSAYWPMGDEIDPVPLLRQLHAAGCTIGLPVMRGADTPLVFRRWDPGTPMADGGFGTRIPTPDAPEVTPEVLLVPMLAFDRSGYRLGYGGGFYDRTLEKLRAANPATLAVGIAYSGQEMPTVPHDSNDQPLDALITEAGPVPLDRGA